MNTLKCAYCGAVLTVSSGKKTVICDHCDNVNILNQQNIDNNQDAINATPSIIAEKLLSDEKVRVKYKVASNYYVKGDLLISARELCFVPDKEYRNLSDLEYKKLQVWNNVNIEDLTNARYLRLYECEKIDINKSLYSSRFTPNEKEVEFYIITKSKSSICFVPLILVPFNSGVIEFGSTDISDAEKIIKSIQERKEQLNNDSEAETQIEFCENEEKVIFEGEKEESRLKTILTTIIYIGVPLLWLIVRCTA